MTGKIIICALALLLGGCPKRNTGPGVVYVPTPPPVARPSEAAPNQSANAITVQAPAPPEPQQASPAPVPAAPPEPPPRRSPRHEERARPDEAVPQPEPANLPAIESSQSTAHDSKLREQVVEAQKQIQEKINLLSREWLSPTERETLEGARGFLQQSLRALHESDFQRASNLAQKASLLVEAVQKAR